MVAPLTFADADAVRAELSSVRFQISPLREKYGAMAIASGRDIWLDPLVLQLSPPEQTYVLGHELCHLAQQRLGVTAGTPARVQRGMLVDSALEMEAHREGKNLSKDVVAQHELPRMLKNVAFNAEGPAGNSRWMQPVISCTFEIDLTNVRIAHIEIGERPGNFTGLGAKIEKAKGENINHIVAWDLIQKGLRRTLKGKTLREVWLWLDNNNNWWDQSAPRGGGGIGRFNQFGSFRGEGKMFGDLMQVVDDAMNEWIFNAYSWNMNLWAGDGKENQAKGRLFAQEKARIKRILSQDCYLKDVQCGPSTQLRYEARDASRQRFVPVVLVDINGHQQQDNTGQQSVLAGNLADGAYLVKTLYPTHKILNLRYHPNGNFGIVSFPFPSQGVGAFAFTKASNLGITRISIYRVSRDFHIKDALDFENTKKTTIASEYFGGKTYTTADDLRNSFLQNVIDIPPSGHEYWDRPGVAQAMVRLKNWATQALADNSTGIPRFGNPASRFT